MKITANITALVHSYQLLDEMTRLVVLLLNLLFGLRINEAATINLVRTIVGYIAGRGAPAGALQGA